MPAKDCVYDSFSFQKLRRILKSIAETWVDLMSRKQRRAEAAVIIFMPAIYVNSCLCPLKRRQMQYNDFGKSYNFWY